MKCILIAPCTVRRHAKSHLRITATRPVGHSNPISHLRAPSRRGARRKVTIITDRKEKRELARHSAVAFHRIARPPLPPQNPQLDSPRRESAVVNPLVFYVGAETCRGTKARGSSGNENGAAAPSPFARGRYHKILTRTLIIISSLLHAGRPSVPAGGVSQLTSPRWRAG